jgi:hypothetical protein
MHCVHERMSLSVQAGREYSVRISFLELYNEELTGNTPTHVYMISVLSMHSTLPSFRRHNSRTPDT